MRDLSYYMNINYKIEIVKDEDGGYVASIPLLKGCATCGETKERVLELVEDAKFQWINAALDEGLEIPTGDENEYSGQFKLRIPKSLHKELATKSKKEGISMNQYCLYLLSKNVGEEIEI